MRKFLAVIGLSVLVCVGVIGVAGASTAPAVHAFHVKHTSHPTMTLAVGPITPSLLTTPTTPVGVPTTEVPVIPQGAPQAPATTPTQQVTTVPTTSASATSPPPNPTPTTVPYATPGPQPTGPSETVNVSQCVVYYTTVQPNPQGIPTSYPSNYAGDCDTANSIASQYPGSTVVQTTVPVTTGFGDLPESSDG